MWKLNKNKTHFTIAHTSYSIIYTGQLVNYAMNFPSKTVSLHVNVNAQNHERSNARLETSFNLLTNYKHPSTFLFIFVKRITVSFPNPHPHRVTASSLLNYENKKNPFWQPVSTGEIISLLLFPRISTEIPNLWSNWSCGIIMFGLLLELKLYGGVRY